MVPEACTPVRFIYVFLRLLYIYVGETYIKVASAAVRSYTGPVHVTDYAMLRYGYV